MSWVVYTTSTGDLIAAVRNEAIADVTVAAGTGRSKLDVGDLPEDFKLNHYHVSSGALVLRAFTDMSDAEQAAALKTTVKSLVQVFDRDLKFHWAGQHSVTNVRPTADIDTEENARRYNNTDVWARAWIGAAWRECDRLENAHASAMSLSDVKKIVAQAKAEIDIGIRTWYAVHLATTTDWAAWLFVDSGNVTMYRTNTSTGGGIVMTDPVMTYSQSDWTDLITDQFFAAFTAAA